MSRDVISAKLDIIFKKLYTSELKSGDSYSMLKQAITVNFINFNMFEGTDYHTEVAAMITGTEEVYSDKFKMHFFELKKSASGQTMITAGNCSCN
ncbi:MAG: Rpn family recombination-promoting nuclease/putative transposase [Eubacterium sp.]|nr:Rpn family recombination-promoting nuclease/putative transposase [Eubacterium sp.]